MRRDEEAARVGFPAIEELMPHRGTVVLLDEILRHDSESTDVRISISKQRWQKRADGSVAGSLAIEYMAQCVAAHEGLLALDEGRPPPTGFLVGVTGLRLEVASFAAGADLVVRSRRVRGRPSLGALSHQCQLFLAVSGGLDGTPGELLAEGRLSVSVQRTHSNRGRND